MMLRKEIVLATVLLLVPEIVYCEPESWMKKEKPSELAIVVSTMFVCPFSKDEIRTITDELLAAAGIEKIVADRNNPADFPALSIVSKCAEIPGGYIYDYDIDFISFIGQDESGKFVVRLGSHGYGSYGQGRSETVRNALYRYIEGAISDYIAANAAVSTDD